MRATRPARWLPVLLGAGLLASSSAAGAATICVQDPACPPGSETQPTLGGAIVLAADGGHPGRDRILLGPATFAEAGLVDDTGNDLDIVGYVGPLPGQTTIAAPPSATPRTTLTIRPPASTLSDVVVMLPQGSDQTGLSLAGTAQDVTVLAPAGTTGLGVSLGTGATFAQGIVALPLSGTTAFSAPQGRGTLEDSGMAAETGVTDVGTVQRVTITAVNGIQSVAGALPASVTVDDALVHLLDGSDGIGLAASQIQVLGAFGAQLTARHVTVIGNGRPGSVGIRVNARGGTGTEAATASATVSGAILRSLGVDLSRNAAGGVSALASATANLTIDYSDYDPLKRSSTVAANAGGTHGAIAEGSHSLNVDPAFRDPGNGDYALRAGSPLIDRGDPAPLAAGESATDLAGNPRVVDGDGNGTKVSDVGAFEYQPSPKPPSTGPPPLVLSALRLAHARFAVAAPPKAHTGTGPPKARANATHRTHRRRRPPRGTAISFRLSRAATVTFTVQRAAAGRRAGRRCVKPKRSLRAAKRCARWVRVGSFARAGVAGANAVVFSGRIARRPLRVGRYRLLAVARSGGERSARRSARFAIVRG